MYSTETTLLISGYPGENYDPVTPQKKNFTTYQSGIFGQNRISKIDQNARRILHFVSTK